MRGRRLLFGSRVGLMDFLDFLDLAVLRDVVAAVMMKVGILVAVADVDGARF